MKTSKSYKEGSYLFWRKWNIMWTANNLSCKTPI